MLEPVTLRRARWGISEAHRSRGRQSIPAVNREAQKAEATARITAVMADDIEELEEMVWDVDGRVQEVEAEQLRQIARVDGIEEHAHATDARLEGVEDELGTVAKRQRTNEADMRGKIVPPSIHVC